MLAIYQTLISHRHPIPFDGSIVRCNCQAHFISSTNHFGLNRKLDRLILNWRRELVFNFLDGLLGHLAILQLAMQRIMVFGFLESAFTPITASVWEVLSPKLTLNQNRLDTEIP